ncbi:hypothetical protein FPOA_03098 [Fusarium poae]|uniref:C3H1-type domain-containing protein n=1 Tax=Fusarium poae TaxID=36050 RepID=A0A1B8B8V7_FUSPO|nr:hypothetical protein FPOA_03098 [Fusarium poae]
MNRPSQTQFPPTSSISYPQGVITSGHPVQAGYGGWQQNRSYQPPAPRNITSGNWRDSQPPVEMMNPHRSGNNTYPIMTYPAPPPALSNDGGPVSISDCLNGFAYCLKRPNGRYTRLVPADMLPGLNELPATQSSAQGMVLLPDLNMKPPQGVFGMNQPVTVKARATDVQNKIDRIVATTPTQQRKAKIYCDKWVHEGTCAFTQQGCKYKHEMPFDTPTQQSLGLFHGFPKWWRDHQEELQKQHKKNPSTPRNQAAPQVDWRGGSNEDTAKAAMVQAPIGAERLQPPFKVSHFPQIREDTAIAITNRPRTGSETDWAVSPSTVQGWPGSSRQSSTGSFDQGYSRQ